MSTAAARDEALRLIHELLGIDRPSIGALLLRAAEVLGASRTSRCIELIRIDPLSSCYSQLAELAGLVVGTQTLGERWWSVRHPRRQEIYTADDSRSPDEILAEGARPPSVHGTTLAVLSAWAADDVADEMWGSPVDYVDLNSWAPDRIALPADSRVGDRVVASFDPGCRVDATVVARPDGSLGSELEPGSCRYSPPADASWAWGIAARIDPQRLPGEEGPDDPHLAPIDPGAAEELRRWALKNGMSEESIGADGLKAGNALLALTTSPPFEPPRGWMDWLRAVEALVDGKPAELAQALMSLRRSRAR